MLRPATKEAHQLLHEGSLALAQAEAAGMKVNRPLLELTIQKVGERVGVLTQCMQGDPVWGTWRRRFRDANIGSREQLGTVLFEELGYTPHGTTASGKRASTDEEALAKVDLPFVRWFEEAESLKKLSGTYLKGVLRELDDWDYLHPMFGLHVAVTYRSNSERINFQNIPIRDKRLGRLIRRVFVPRSPRHRIVEVDISGAEVRVACCYCHDPTLIHDTLEGDMHRDMAAEIFMMPQTAVPKPVRQAAKGAFVFAEFYGDYYVEVARNLWQQAATGGTGGAPLTTKDGIPLIDHLATRGIMGLGQCNGKTSPLPHTFEHHIKAVEDRFWNQRFRVYGRWRKNWYQAYLQNGGFNTLTGFRVTGLYTKNQVINNPIQGSAFHCLLWSFIRLAAYVRDHLPGSYLIGQIHDSIVADILDEHVPAFLEAAHRIMTEEIRKWWGWLIIPLAVEAEASPAGASWFDKEPVTIGATAV